MSDDPNVNTLAEILANVRNRALEEAAVSAERRVSKEAANIFGSTTVRDDEALAIAEQIRALKTEPK